MKAKRADIERALASSAGTIRLFLLHGPDTAGSAELARRVVVAAGADAERVFLSPASLKADPALLADEAASLSLFGGRRVVVVEGGGDDVLNAVEGLLSASVVPDPVVVTSGTLKKGSKLLALVEASPLAMAFASYVPEGRDADRMVIDLGRAVGLGIAPDVARRIAEAGAGDRAIIAHELDKFALFLDAAFDRPVMLEHDAVDALLAGAEEGDVARIVDAVLDGELATLDREVGQMPAASEIPVVRALLRRAMLLARHRAEVERGSALSTVMASAGKSLYYMDKASIERQLGGWPAARIVIAITRLLSAERELKAVGSIGAEVVLESLYAIAQSSARRAGRPR